MNNLPDMSEILQLIGKMRRAAEYILLVDEQSQEVPHEASPPPDEVKEWAETVMENTT